MDKILARYFVCLIEKDLKFAFNGMGLPNNCLEWIEDCLINGEFDNVKSFIKKRYEKNTENQSDNLMLEEQQMTPQEAIEILKDLRTYDDDCETDVEALTMAIDILEKQIPDDICEKVVKRFGKTAQLIMAMEEMSELIQALSKDVRGKGSRNNISEEIADVEIMLAQLKIIYRNDNDVDEWRADKLSLLQKRIDKEV